MPRALDAVNEMRQRRPSGELDAMAKRLESETNEMQSKSVEHSECHHRRNAKEFYPKLSFEDACKLMNLEKEQKQVFRETKKKQDEDLRRAKAKLDNDLWALKQKQLRALMALKAELGA